jgi:hypothetical protein
MSTSPCLRSTRFYYLCGCDGTGKTTHAELLAAYLAGTGRCVRRVWLRYPFLTSIPLLAYARWRGLGGFHEAAGSRHSYWDFGHSRLMRALLPWSLLVDALLAAAVRIYIPLLLGATIVCERFVIDILADLIVAFDDPSLAARLPGGLYPRLIPPRATVLMLDLDADTIRRRRPGLAGDARLETRLVAFRSLAKDLGLQVLSTAPALEPVHRQILAAGGTHG